MLQKLFDPFLLIVARGDFGGQRRGIVSHDPELCDLIFVCNPSRAVDTRRSLMIAPASRSAYWCTAPRAHGRFIPPLIVLLALNFSAPYGRAAETQEDPSRDSATRVSTVASFPGSGQGELRGELRGQSAMVRELRGELRELRGQSAMV